MIEYRCDGCRKPIPESERRISVRIDENWLSGSTLAVIEGMERERILISEDFHFKCFQNKYGSALL